MMPPTRARHRFSVKDYKQMVEFGILTENDRVELIRGEIVEKMTIGDRHAAAVTRLTRFFYRELDAGTVIVYVQNPIRLQDSVPEPDVTLLSFRQNLYADGTPTSGDVLLLIEVADSSLEFDRTVKGPLYAENNISHYWIINLIDNCIEAYSNPQSGLYQDMQKLERGATLPVPGFAGCDITVDEIV